MAAEPRSGIYEIVNLINGKRYIGSAVDIEARWRGHRHQLRNQRHHSAALQRAWLKYGAQAFEFKVLCECDCPQLIPTEQEHIDRLGPEYNCCRVAGSTLGTKRSAASRAKQSASRKGMKLSAAHRAAIGFALRGKPKNPASIEKTALAKRGVKLPPISDAHKAAISAATKGRKLADHHVAAIRRAKIGQPRPDMVGNSYGSRVNWTPELRAANGARHRGRKCSEETKARMRAAWERRKAAPS